METLNSPEIEENMDDIQIGFGEIRCLRKNPKKSWWVSSIPMKEGSLCGQCGKGFKSDKALFGHMRLHSKRKASAVKKIVEMPNAPKKKRSERRYNKYNNSCSSSSVTVSFDSVVVDQELKDIAVCLLMLGNGGFCSFSDDDDGDSVKMDPSFPVESAHITCEGHDNVVGELNSCELGCGYVSFKEEVAEFRGLDRGFSKFNQENLEPGPSFDCMKKPVFGVETVSQAELHESTVVKDRVVEMVNELGCGYVSFKEGVAAYCGLDRGFLKSTQENPEPGPSFDCLQKLVSDVQTENQAELHDTEVKEVASDSVVDCLKKPVSEGGSESRAELCDTKIKVEKTDSIVEVIPLEKQHHQKYICKICNKIFKSGQSLGGHKLHCPISRRYRSSVSVSVSVSGACSEASIEAEVLIHDHKAECATLEVQGSENRVEKLGGHEEKKRGRKRKHKCVLCCKSFESGQALGGHMRAHVTEKLGSNDKQYDGVEHISDPEIQAPVCGLNQQTLEISSKFSEAVLVGVLEGV